MKWEHKQPPIISSTDEHKNKIQRTIRKKNILSNGGMKPTKKSSPAPSNTKIMVILATNQVLQSQKKKNK